MHEFGSASVGPGAATITHRGLITTVQPIRSTMATRTGATLTGAGGIPIAAVGRPAIVNWFFGWATFGCCRYLPIMNKPRAEARGLLLAGGASRSAPAAPPPPRRRRS